jgi:hypothetical protein
MHARSGSVVLSALLIAPAAAAAAAQALAALGVPAPAHVLDAAFAALGVTGASPLPLRQAWYLGLYIVAPGVGAAIACAAAIGTSARRMPSASLTALGALLSAYWIVASLLDA